MRRGNRTNPRKKASPNEPYTLRPLIIVLSSTVQRIFTNLVVAPLLLLVTLPLGKNDEELPEDGDEVDEEHKTVGYVVPVTSPSLLHDGLRVVHDEAAHDRKSDVQFSLVEESRANKDVENAEPEEGIEDGHEGATQVKILSSRGEDGRKGERAEDESRAKQGFHHNSGIDHDGEFEQRAKVDAREEAKAGQQPQPLQFILALVGRRHQHNQANDGPNAGEDASTNNRAIEVDKGTHGTAA